MIGFISIFILFLQTTASSSEAVEPEFSRVIVPVVDLRSETKDAPPDSYFHDPLEESQILFGEKVQVFESRGDWVRVEAVAQKEFTHVKAWQGYPGWVRQSALGVWPSTDPSARFVVRRSWASLYSSPSGSARKFMEIPFGSRIDVLSRKGNRVEIRYQDGRPAWMRASDLEPFDRKDSPNTIAIKVWRNAKSFIGVPYYWGGLSAYGAACRTATTGVDCSGLTHLAYRVAGVAIPRDSHEQWMKSIPLTRSQLRRGDLVFLANAAKPDKVSHVAMYVGGEFLIEGPGTGLKVHRVTFKKKLGRRLAQIESGDTVGEKVVYFGRPIPQD